MQIRNLTTLEEGYHRTMFPNVSFAAGDIDCTPEWLASVNCEQVIPEPYVPTEADILRNLTSAVQNMLDTKAREKNYDNILSACTYVSSTNAAFAIEGQACVEWRDACWVKCYEVLTDVQAELRTIPTAEELLAEMPVAPW